MEDKWHFLIATLLSSTLVYNHKGIIDSDTIQKLSYPLQGMIQIIFIKSTQSRVKSVVRKMIGTRFSYQVSQSTIIKKHVCFCLAQYFIIVCIYFIYTCRPCISQRVLLYNIFSFSNVLHSEIWNVSYERNWISKVQIQKQNSDLYLALFFLTVNGHTQRPLAVIKGIDVQKRIFALSFAPITCLI